MQNFLIIGLKISGISVAKLLNVVGEQIFLYDCDRKTIRKARKFLNFLSQKCFVTKISKKLLNKIDCIVLSPGVDSKEWEQIVFEYNIEVVSEIEIAFRFCRGITAAITGTNGKTTTTLLLNHILNECGVKSFAVGNIGNAFSQQCQNIRENEIAVCEVSSFQLENIVSFKPKVVGFLNLKPDHLDRYKAFDVYKKAKENIFKNFDKSCFAVLNYGDKNVRLLYKPDMNTLWFSSSEKLPTECDGAYLQKNTIFFTKNNKNTARISLKNVKLIGKHNVENIMCACLMANCLGVDLSKMEEVVCSFTGVEHRMEFVARVFNSDFYNDSKATNIASTIAAIKCFNKDIFLILGGSDKGENFANLFINIPKNVKQIFVYGQTSTKIVQHATLAGFVEIKKFETLDEAFNEVVKNLYENLIVLFSPACASFDQFKNYEERGEKFKRLVRELINEQNVL